jgi:hypothetical protein
VFEDIPDALNNFVRDEAGKLSDINDVTLLAARAITNFYIHADYVERDDEPFLRFPNRQPGVAPAELAARIYRIASTILSLRNEPGFAEFCRRFAKQNLRSVFFEAHAAGIFKRHGFSISARESTGTRGEDFDFAISAPGVLANVEATSITVPRFSAKTIENTLTHKRKQLPPTAPAVIVCFVPHAWRLSVWDLQWELGEMARRFLRGTQRINRLIFTEDVVLKKDDAFLTFMHYLQFPNERARIPSPELDRMMDVENPDGHSAREALDNLQWDESKGFDELGRWMDWLLPR